jgi:hypothetical protein
VWAASLVFAGAAVNPNAFNSPNSGQYAVAIPAELCEYVRIAAITEE